jgi:hypothetical protein
VATPPTLKKAQYRCAARQNRFQGLALGANRRPNKIEGLVECFGIFASGYREIGALAAATLHLLGRIGDEFGCIETRVGGYGSHDRDTATVGCGTENNGFDAGAVTHCNSEVADSVSVESVDTSNDNAVDSLFGELTRTTCSSLSLEVADSSAKVFHFGNTAFDGVDEFVSGNTHCFSRCLDASLVFTKSFKWTHA